MTADKERIKLGTVMSKKIGVAILIIVAAVGFFSLTNDVQAANCGGDTACACGDTVTASTTFTSNLTCTGHGLIVGANNITIDGGSYTITGDASSSDYGINNSGGWDGVTIKNLNITNFGRGISFAISILG